MSERIEVIGVDELSEKVQGYLDPRSYHREFLVDGSGLLAYATASFPGASTSEIYGQFNEREPEGRGAHFDVYQGFVERDYPWISIFNLAGSNAVRTAVLPQNLADAYFDIHPTPTDAAFDARRDFSSIAFGASDVSIATGELTPERGLVLPQREDGPHIVHDIVPDRADDAGTYVKLAVPNDDPETRERMEEGKYKPLDALVTEMMTRGQANQPPRRALRIDRPVPSPRSSGRRPCNLD